VTARTLFQHPKKLQHVSLSTASYSASRVKICLFCHITEYRPEELASDTTSCMSIYGIEWFDFRVVCPLCALLSENLLILWTFPALHSCFTILLSYFCMLLCFLSATNQPHFPFYLALFYYKIPCT